MYNSYLDELKVTGVDVHRSQVRMEHIPQGAGLGVSGFHWEMEVAAPHGKLKLLRTTGQSEAIGAWWPACEVHVCTPHSAALRCPTPQLWRRAQTNEIDWQYLACSCIA
jgi:hypothetical protein